MFEPRNVRLLDMLQICRAEWRKKKSGEVKESRFSFFVGLSMCPPAMRRSSLQIRHSRSRFDGEFVEGDDKSAKGIIKADARFPSPSSPRSPPFIFCPLLPFPFPLFLSLSLSLFLSLFPFPLSPHHPPPPPPTLHSFLFPRYPSSFSLIHSLMIPAGFYAFISMPDGSPYPPTPGPCGIRPLACFPLAPIVSRS
jgi:hypothetical protein